MLGLLNDIHISQITVCKKGRFYAAATKLKEKDVFQMVSIHTRFKQTLCYTFYATGQAKGVRIDIDSLLLVW